MIHCKHCQLSCKTLGKTECAKYNPIASKPVQLVEGIKKAYAKQDYKKGRELQQQLDEINYGYKHFPRT